MNQLDINTLPVLIEGGYCQFKEIFFPSILKKHIGFLDNSYWPISTRVVV
jgi:hypothetical protein